MRLHVNAPTSIASGDMTNLRAEFCSIRRVSILEQSQGYFSTWSSDRPTKLADHRVQRMLGIAREFSLGELIQCCLVDNHHTCHCAFCLRRRRFNLAKFFEVDTGNLGHQLHEL